MAAPEPHPHIGAALLAMACAPASVALAWGQTTLWGVVPCALVTVALVVAPVTRWTKSDVNEEIEGFARAAPFDGHALQEGAAREMAAVTSSRRPIGCVGLFVGVVLPLILIRPEYPATIAAGVLAALGFLLAWIRRVRRETEASAGRGVPL